VPCARLPDSGLVHKRSLKLFGALYLVKLIFQGASTYSVAEYYLPVLHCSLGCVVATARTGEPENESFIVFEESMLVYTAKLVLSYPAPAFTTSFIVARSLMKLLGLETIFDSHHPSLVVIMSFLPRRKDLNSGNGNGISIHQLRMDSYFSQLRI
jgi:hypothetical protein